MWIGVGVEAAVADWLGNVVILGGFRDELPSFQSRMNISLVAMEPSRYIYPMYRALRVGAVRKAYETKHTFTSVGTEGEIEYIGLDDIHSMSSPESAEKIRRS